jgi:hypothetical protein
MKHHMSAGASMPSEVLLRGSQLLRLLCVGQYIPHTRAYCERRSNQVGRTGSMKADLLLLRSQWCAQNHPEVQRPQNKLSLYLPTQ